MDEDNKGVLQRVRHKKVKKQHQIVTTLHYGSYDYIGYAYMALEEWVERNGYILRVIHMKSI